MLLSVSVKENYVDVGFWAKKNLENYSVFLVSEGRAVVKSLRYYSIEDVNEEILLQILEGVNKHKSKGFWRK